MADRTTTSGAVPTTGRAKVSQQDQKDLVSQEGSLFSRSTTERPQLENAKRVKFNISETEIATVLPLNMYTEKEIQSYWYTKDELTSIIDDCFDLIHRTTTTKNHNKLWYPATTTIKKNDLRGMENIIKSEYKRRKIIILQAREAVLNEQYIQSMDREHKNAEVLAAIYRRFAIQSQTEALKMGSEDQEAALAEWDISSSSYDNDESSTSEVKFFVNNPISTRFRRLLQKTLSAKRNGF